MSKATHTSYNFLLAHSICHDRLLISYRTIEQLKNMCVFFPSGLIVSDKKGKNPKTYLYETMETWGGDGEEGHFTVKINDEKPMLFECAGDVAAEITDTMTRHAQVLAKTMKAKRKAEKKAKKEAKAAATAAAATTSTDEPTDKTDDEGATGVVLDKSMVKKGLAVWLTKDSSQRGVILKKAGKNAQVDFSESGGDPKKFIPYSDLSRAA